MTHHDQEASTQEEAGTAPPVWRSIAKASSRLGLIWFLHRRDTIDGSTLMVDANLRWETPLVSRYVDRSLMKRTMHIVQQSVKGFVACRAFAQSGKAMHNAHMQMANIRKAQKLSQRALAEKVGVDASTIQRAESMSDSAMLKTYKMAAQALGVTLSDLFADDRTPIESVLLDVFRRIPEDRHDELVRILELAANPPRQKDQ